MADLLIVLFLIVFWVISFILKQSGKTPTHYEEDNELENFFRFPKLNITPEILKQENTKIEHRVSETIEPEKKPEAVKTEINVPRHTTKTSEIESGKLYHNMLKSKTSLRDAIIIKEILGSPVSLR